MSKSKYVINPNYLLQLENDELRLRIKELKAELIKIKQQLYEKESQFESMPEMQPKEGALGILPVKDLKGQTHYDLYQMLPNQYKNPA